MNNLHLAAMALLIVVVAPIIVGYAWPTDTEQIDTWTAEEGLDITGSIATSDIPIIDSYSGPMNHYWLYDPIGFYSGYNPVGYTSSPSSIPKLSYTVSSESVTTNPWVINFGSYSGYRTDFITMANLTVDMADGESYTCSTAVYMPGANAIYIMGLGHHGEALKASDVDTISVQGASVSEPLLLTIREYTKVADTYVNMAKGFLLDDTDLRWFNGMDNHIVDMWVRSASITEDSTISGGGSTVFLSVTDGTIYVNGEVLGTTSAYPYIDINFDYDSQKIAVKGLVNADSFTDSTWRSGNSIEYSSTFSVIDSLAMSGHFEYEVKRTYSEIGTGKGISNASIVPYSYYPHYSWQVSFESPARFGESIDIGSYTFPVSEGKITFTDVNGEEHTVTIRDMAVLSLVFDNEGPQQNETWQHVYINGYELEKVSPTSTYGIDLNGDWYVQVTVSDVSQGEQDSYIWDIGTFGLDRAGYCMVGLITSVLVMIGAGLYGKRDGAKAAIIIFCMGVSSIVYLMLM